MTRIRIGLLLVACTLIATSCGEDGLVLTTEGTLPRETSTTSGEDPTLTALTDSCNEGVFTACDALWELADAGSELEDIAASCGGRVSVGDEGRSGTCVDRFGEPSTSTTPPTTIAGTILPPVDFMVDPRNNTWNVILASVSLDNPLDDAVGYAAKYAEAGLEARVFLSSDYPSLNPGYWVVYVGGFADSDAAAAFCGQLKEGGVDCYARFVGDEQ